MELLQQLQKDQTSWEVSDKNLIFEKVPV